MRARCKAPYQIHAPTTAQRKGQGFRSRQISKTRGRLSLELMACSDVCILSFAEIDQRE